MANRSRNLLACIFFFLPVTACSRPSQYDVKDVSSDGYESAECWFNDSGEITSFMVLAEEAGTAVPYLVSARCMLTEGYSSYEEAMVHKLNTILLMDYSGLIQSRFPQIRILSNIATDGPVPYPDSKVYYFQSSVSHSYIHGKKVYTPTSLRSLVNTDIRYLDFLRLSVQERTKLPCRFTKCTY